MQNVQVVASAARTSTGNSGVVRCAAVTTRSGRARFFLHVTEASGTSPTLNVAIKASTPGGLKTMVSFAQKTAASEETVLVDGCPEEVQVEWTIAGTTPSFTFDVQCVREG